MLTYLLPPRPLALPPSRLVSSRPVRPVSAKHDRDRDNVQYVHTVRTYIHTHTVPSTVLSTQYSSSQEQSPPRSKPSRKSASRQRNGAVGLSEQMERGEDTTQVVVVIVGTSRDPVRIRGSRTRKPLDRRLGEKLGKGPEGVCRCSLTHIYCWTPAPPLLGRVPRRLSAGKEWAAHHLLRSDRNVHFHCLVSSSMIQHADPIRQSRTHAATPTTRPRTPYGPAFPTQSIPSVT